MSATPSSEPHADDDLAAERAAREDAERRAAEAAEQLERLRTTVGPMVADARSELERAWGDSERLRGELESTQAMYEQQLAASVDGHMNTHDRLREALARVEELQAGAGASAGDPDELRDARRRADEAITARAKLAAELQQVRSAAEGELAAARAELADMAAARDRLEQQLADAAIDTGDASGRLEAELAETRTEVHHREARLRELGGELVAARAELEERAEHVSALERELQQHAERALTLERQVEQLRVSVDGGGLGGAASTDAAGDELVAAREEARAERERREAVERELEERVAAAEELKLMLAVQTGEMVGDDPAAADAPARVMEMSWRPEEGRYVPSAEPGSEPRPALDPELFERLERAKRLTTPT